MPQLTQNNQATWADYYELTKPNVVALIVFCGIVGMLLSTPTLPQISTLIFGALGIGLSASSAAVINHVLDIQIDQKMSRTKSRPLPQGRLSQSKALLFSLILCLISMLILFAFINTITAILTFLSLIGYAIIYTVFLKRATPQNIVIGGAAGAAPPRRAALRLAAPRSPRPQLPQLALGPILSSHRSRIRRRQLRSW